MTRRYPFNRTIVELKYVSNVESNGASHAFNRTIVELKLPYPVEKELSRWPFNRTIVELKFNASLSVAITPALLIVP